MLQILLIMLFRIPLKIPHYAHCYSFYARHCYYYSIVPIANDIRTMHKCCKRLCKHNNITQVMLYKLQIIKFQW